MLPEVMSDLETEELTTAEALEALRPAWAELWAHCPSATPFQSPAWLLPWWKHVGQGELWAVAVRRSGRLVGLAPLYVYPDPERGVRKVFLLGIGLSDYLDALALPGFEEEVAARVFACLDRNRGRWDRCDLQQLRRGSPLLAGVAPADWSDTTGEQEVCPALALRGAGGEAAIPASFLKKLNYYRHRSEQEGDIRIERAQEDNFEELFEALLRLHRARWTDQNLPGMLADEALQRFHREAARGLLDGSVLRLYGYRLDGRIVASLYGLQHRERTYYYLSGFDPALSELSLGHQIVHHAIEEAAREGARAFDFLRGSESYKYDWGAENRVNYRRRLQPALSEP